MDTFRFRDDTGRSALRDTTETEAVQSARAWQMMNGARMRVYRFVGATVVEVPVPAPLVRVSDVHADLRVGRRSA